MEEELSYKGFAKGSILVTSVHILQSLRGIILLPFVTKILGTTSYGIWVQVGVLIGLMMPVATLALHGALLRFLAGEEDKRKIKEGFYSIIFFVLGVSLILTLLLAVLSGPIAKSFFEGERLIVLLAALNAPIYGLNTMLLMYFRTFRQMRKYSIFTVLQAYVELGLLIYVILAGYGLVGLVVAMLVTRVSMAVAMLCVILVEIGFGIPKFSRMKEYLSLSLPFVPVNICAWVTSASDRFMISFFMGALFVGYYNPGYSLGYILAIFIIPISIVLPPYIYKLYEQGEQNQVTSYLSYGLKYYLMLAIPAAFGLCLLSKPLLLILSNQEIATNGYFVTFFVVVAVMLNAIENLVTLIIVSVKKTRIAGVSSITAAAVNFGLNLIFIPWLGIMGAAITTLLAGVISLAMRAYIAFRHFTFPVDWMSIIKVVVASIVMGLGIWYYHPTSVIEIIISVVGGILVYGAILVILGGIKRGEINLLRSLFITTHTRAS